MKTDRKDSQKLAHLLSKGLLRGIFIPTEKELSHRDVFRRRQGLVTDRIRVMNRIRSKLLFLEMFLPEELSDWSVAFVKHLKGLRLSDRWEQERFDRLLEEYASLTQLINHQTKLLRELAKTESYRTNVALLKSFSGMGVPTTMLLLLELGDVTRFRQGDQLSAYAGLSPSQYSSGERVCLGRIIGHQMRGEQENFFKGLKNDVGVGNMLTGDLHANAFYFRPRTSCLESGAMPCALLVALTEKDGR